MGGGGRNFLIKTWGRANIFFRKKYQNSPSLPPQEKTYLPLIQKTLSMKWGGGDFFFGSHASKSGFSCVLSHFCLLLLMLIFKCCRYNLFIEPTDLKRKEKKKRHLFLETSFEILHSYLVSLDWFHMFCLRLMFPTSTGKSPSRIFLLTFIAENVFQGELSNRLCHFLRVIT